MIDNLNESLSVTTKILGNYSLIPSVVKSIRKSIKSSLPFQLTIPTLISQLPASTRCCLKPLLLT